MKMVHIKFKIPKFLNYTINTNKLSYNKVLIHPFAGGYNHDMRELPINHWKVIVDYLLQNKFQIYLSGSSSDLAKRFYVPKNKNFFDIRGKLTIIELKQLLENIYGVISVNTGIMHLASLMNLKLICINGPTREDRWGPINPKSKCINLSNDLGGNFLNLGFEYPKNYKYSMHSIRINSLMNTVKEFL